MDFQPDAVAERGKVPHRPSQAARIFQVVIALNIGALLVVGFAFRVVRLGSVPGLNADEYFCLVAFRDIVHGDAHGLFLPTGRILAVFYALPVYLFDLVVPRSAATIRFPAVFSGLLTAVVGFWLLRRVRSTFTASLVTALAVVMPIQIAYSRIGWEYSQIPLATLLIVAFALGDSIWLCALALGAGVLVHPAIAYLAPIVGLTVGNKLFKQAKTRDARGLAWLLALPVVATGLFVLILWAIMGGATTDARDSFAAVSGNLTDGGKIYSFIELYSNLFGARVARQNLTDSPVIAFDAFNAAFLAVNAFLYGAYFATFGARRRLDPNADRELCVVVGLLIAISGFFLTRGPGGVTPPYERYALFLVMPSLIVMTVMAESLSSTASRRGFVQGVVCAAAWLLVVDFKTGYFDYFETTGGEGSHVTYRTGPVDPKLAALYWVEARGASPVIYMKEWRSYWPVQYVASTEPSVRVISLEKSLWTGGLSPEEFAAFLAAPGNDFLATLRGTHGYVIGFDDATFDVNIRAALPGAQVTRKDFPDKSGHPLVSVWFVDG